MPEIELHITTYAEVIRLFPEVITTELIFTPSTELYLVRDSATQEAVGICGFRWWKRSVTFKTAYIDPKWRGQGYYSATIDKRIEMARLRGVTYIDGHLTKMSTHEWLKRGAEIRKRYKFGIVSFRMYL